MIECPFCQTTHIQNTIFCDECGQYLLKDSVWETGQVTGDKTPSPNDTKDDRKITFLSDHEAKSPAVRLKIGAGKREVEVPLDKVIQIGRFDPASNLSPEVDLTQDDVVNKCISRRHAIISKQHQRVLVEDRGSVNGTFINDQKLIPHLPKILNNGDTLKLGRLQIQVQILGMGQGNIKPHRTTDSLRI